MASFLCRMASFNYPIERVGWLSSYYVVFEPGCFELDDRFYKNPILLSDHYHTIANVKGLWSDIKQGSEDLRGVFTLDSSDPDYRVLEGKIKAGVLRGLSVGARVIKKREEKIPLKEREGEMSPSRRVYVQRAILYECSLVSIPAFPDALVLGEITEDKKKEDKKE